jgi:PH domain
MADREVQQQQNTSFNTSTAEECCSIILEEDERHHVFRDNVDEEEEELEVEDVVVVEEQVLEDPRHNIFPSVSREDYFNDSSNLSDFVVSDEEGDSFGGGGAAAGGGGGGNSSSPAPRQRGQYHNQFHQHPLYHRSFNNNSASALMNMSQSSLGSANTDANATQRLLLELQKQEDTSTSFVPSVMGNNEGDDDDNVNNLNGDMIQEVPMMNRSNNNNTSTIDDNDVEVDEDDAASNGGGGGSGGGGGGGGLLVRPDAISGTKRATSLNTTPNSSSATTMIPTSAALFRYLRSLATGGGGGGGNNNNNTNATSNNNNNKSGGENVKSGGGGTGGGGGGGDNDSSSSSENHELYSSSSSSSTSTWSDDEHQEHEDHDHDPAAYYSDAINVDWNQLPALPNRFCNTKLRVPPYLDAAVLQLSQDDKPGLTKSDANAFVWEHGTLLRAVLQLLAERDQVGVEGSIVATDNIWKKGSLKKLSALGLRSAGTWKVKYVEIRQGNLCYYGDSGTGQRKIIHLRQADAIVQESSMRGPGHTWELIVQGTKYYWSATSETERQLWMKAVQNAMIGDEGPRRELDLQPYQAHLDVYRELREAVQQAESQKAYLAAIQGAIKYRSPFNGYGNKRNKNYRQFY